MLRALVGGLVSALLAAVGVTAAAQPAAAATFTPVADSYVDASQPTRNFGTSTAFRVDNSPVVTSYLRFNVQGVGPVSSAKLELFANTSSGQSITVKQVADTTWPELGLTYDNRPAYGVTLASVAGVTAGTRYSFDVSRAVAGNGLVSFAVITSGPTAISFSSREGANAPSLLAPATGGGGGGGTSSRFDVSGVHPNYTARANTGKTYQGTVKSVVESAMQDLNAAGGGDIVFAAGTFDLGSDYLLVNYVTGIRFVGAGRDATILKNNNSSAADTEVFNSQGATRVQVLNMTVSAGGPVRTTSDALDFDRGNEILLQNVKVVASRGRGIVFDGKDSGWTSERNVVLGCVIQGVPGDGIELLASSNNRIEGCSITNVGGYGIQVTKSSPIAPQPNKKSNNNVITGNTIDQAGSDGINVLGSDRNHILNNTITNSSDDRSGRDGIRLMPYDNVTCNDNEVAGNRATDNQATKTQRYGLSIADPLCNRTVVGPNNNFAGNASGELRNLGTGTIFR